MTYEPSVYGYVNGKAVYSRDEWIFERRHFGAIQSDAELLAFAEKASYGWYHAGHKRTFTSFYLSDYAMSEPYASLTKKEFERLKELQKEAQAEEKRIEDAKQWRFIENVYFADNSIEAIYEDKDGNRKSVMVTAPHGDACY